MKEVLKIPFVIVLRKGGGSQVIEVLEIPFVTVLRGGGGSKVIEVLEMPFVTVLRELRRRLTSDRSNGNALCDSSQGRRRLPSEGSVGNTQERGASQMLEVLEIPFVIVLREG